MYPTYAQRNELLPKLGFPTYYDYLSSMLWADIRSAVLDRDNRHCKMCGMSASMVHHLDYSEMTLRGNLLDGLVAICRECHEKVEFTEDGKKRSLLGAMRAYRKFFKKGVTKTRDRKKWASNRPRCVCGNFRRHNRLKCRACEPGCG